MFKIKNQSPLKPQTETYKATSGITDENLQNGVSMIQVFCRYSYNGVSLCLRESGDDFVYWVFTLRAGFNGFHSLTLSVVFETIRLS